MMVALGLLAGLHAASWGAYKDIPYEGFRLSSYLRSIVLAAVIAALLGVTVLGHAAAPLVVLGAVYALERFATEWWKAVIREDDQRVYSIPMRLAVRGRPIDRAGRRYLIGLLVLAACLMVAIGIDQLQAHLPHLPPWFAVVTVGSTAGWATAIGGARKDAPVEGFSGRKFLRSPLVATAWAVPLSLLTTNWGVLALAAAGFAAASIETYKTFLTSGRPPGKFATKTIRFRRSALRHVLVAVHVSLWATLALALTAGLFAPIDGLSSAWLTGLDTHLPAAVETTLAGMAAGLAALVAMRDLPPLMMETSR